MNMSNMPEASSLSANREIYSRAPVMEAAIDIRCTNRPNFTVSDIALLGASLSSDFREQGEIVEKSEEFRADGSRRTTERPIGLMFRRNDGRGVVQLQVEGFTYSRVAPYERWEPFRDDGKRLWDIYSETSKPQGINRLGVRYINRIGIGTATFGDVASFLKVYPVTPWGSEPPIGFTVQVRHAQGENMGLVVNVGTLQNPLTREAAILLDLDASFQTEMAPDSGGVWNMLEQLHVIAEEAFEASITDRVRELIR